MSTYSSGNENAKNFYEILDVPVNAGTATIRKSYLKKSLKYHPDKNPNNQQEAKARFVEIGEAYETLSDPVRRQMYDKELRATGGRKSNLFTKKPHGNGSDDHVYENYADAFDATVAGMSEAELAAAMGTVSALAGIVGSVIGSRVIGGSTRGQQHGRRSNTARTSILSSAGSMVGGIVASELASSSLRALHQDSINRLNYKEDCRRAVERGEPMPERPQTSFIGNKIGNILKNSVDSVTNMASDGTNDNKNDRGSFYSSNQNNKDPSDGKNERDSSDDIGGLWKMAAAAFKAAEAARQK